MISQGAWSMNRPACAPSASGVQIVWDDTRNNAQPIAGFSSDRTDILSSIVLPGGAALSGWVTVHGQHLADLVLGL